MCIQVDNPMNILNQDLARQFISSSTPEEKYNVTRNLYLIIPQLIFIIINNSFLNFNNF